MKNFRLILLSLLIITFSLPAFIFSNEKANASESSKVNTGIFLPTSYLQYYKLNEPFAICRYKDDIEEFVAISHKKGLVIYKNEKFATIDLDLNDTAVTVLQRYQNYLFYLYDSFVHYIDITDFENENWSSKSQILTVTKKDGTTTDLHSGFSFSICGDEIICHTSDNIYRYSLTTDLSGKLTAKQTSSIDQKKTSMLHLSKNGFVYFSTSDQDGIFVWDGNSVKTFYSSAQSVRTITEDENGENIYYSCPNGIFSLNTLSGEYKTVALSVEHLYNSDLGNIYSPQGICLLGDRLWVVDSAINAVQEIDLTLGEFTQFAITTNSSAVNRLSDKVKDIVVDKDKIYALDEGRIVVVNDINSEDRTYHRINLNTPVDKFSAGDGYICYANGKTLSLCKITSTDDENIFELSDLVSTTLSDTGEVMDICFSEGVFYVICTKVLSDNLSHPIIFKIDVTKNEPTLTEFLLEGTESGSALQITADVFGTVYYCAVNGTNYDFFSYDGNEIKKIATKNGLSNLKNIQTDFDGKLYCLFDNNEIAIIDGEDVQLKQLSTSENLGNIAPSKSMCLSCNSETAYFIFEGLILKSTYNSDLNIATPHTIDIPKDFSFAFDENQLFARVKDGSKLFKVDVNKLDGEHFIFLDYLQATSSNDDYVIKKLNDKYSLLIKDRTVAVARNSDIIDTFTYESATNKKFAVVEFTPYSIPVLEKHYALNHSVKKFSEVEIIGKTNFNGIKYFIVKDGDVLGYIPDTFFIDSIITEDGDTTVLDAYVYKKGGVIVYDESGKEIGVFNKKTKVTIISVGAKKMAIIFGDTIGYVEVDSIVSNSRDDIMKSIAIILASLSICITSLYFEKRYLLKR